MFSSLLSISAFIFYIKNLNTSLPAQAVKTTLVCTSLRRQQRQHCFNLLHRLC